MTPHPYPAARTLRMVALWQRRPIQPNLRRMIAVHEAGHVVLMRWIGLESPAATIHVGTEGSSGEAHWPDRQFFAELDNPGPDETGILAATAASVFHAGVVAEQIELGSPWLGPIHYPEASDYQRADEMLSDSFGRHASGAHAFAQQVARHVLMADWACVCEIAHELEQHGCWQR